MVGCDEITIRTAGSNGPILICNWIHSLNIEPNLVFIETDHVSKSPKFNLISWWVIQNNLNAIKTQTI